MSTLPNMKKKPEEVVEFYNKRGTAELYIKEGKRTFNWTRLSCKRFRDNQARLQLNALAYNLTSILRNIELPEEKKMVAIHHPVEADQGRRPCCASCPCYYLPTG